MVSCGSYTLYAPLVLYVQTKPLFMSDFWRPLQLIQRQLLGLQSQANVLRPINFDIKYINVCTRNSGGQSYSYKVTPLRN
jgi:hypothetical protein